jgi:hypothetical protein
MRCAVSDDVNEHARVARSINTFAGDHRAVAIGNGVFTYNDAHLRPNRSQGSLSVGLFASCAFACDE